MKLIAVLEGTANLSITGWWLAPHQLLRIFGLLAVSVCDQSVDWGQGGSTRRFSGVATYSSRVGRLFRLIQEVAGPDAQVVFKVGRRV